MEKSILSEFLDKLVERTKNIKVGDPMDPTTQMGALISEEHLMKVLEYVNIGRDEVSQLPLCFSLCKIAACFFLMVFRTFHNLQSNHLGLHGE